MRETSDLPALSLVFAFVIKKLAHPFWPAGGAVQSSHWGASWILGISPLQKDLRVTSTTVQANLTFSPNNPTAFLPGAQLLPPRSSLPRLVFISLWDVTTKLTLS